MDVGAVGVVVKVGGKVGPETAVKTLLVWVPSGAMTQAANSTFPLGLFTNPLMVLLIATKNKLSFGQAPSARSLVYSAGFDSITAVDLQGIVVNDDPGQLGNYVSYSTLPFVYICDNDLGTGSGSLSLLGKVIPIFGDVLPVVNEDGEQLSTWLVSNKFANVALDRRSGHYAILPPTDNFSVTVDGAVEVDTDTWNGCLKAYNADFLDDGLGSTMFDQLKESVPAGENGYRRQGAAYAQVLNDVAERWHRKVISGTENAASFHYNIGAALFVRKRLDQTSQTDLYGTLIRSLNIKGRNKAAHAEVRIALVLDFLAAYDETTAAPNTMPFPEPWRTPENVASLAVSLSDMAADGAQFTLFSSLLPCYMCEGVIETTDGGVITSINGSPVNLPASFPGLPSSRALPIADTVYFDIDAAVDYRHVEGVRYVDLLTPMRTIMVVRPVSIRAHLPTTGVLTSTADPRITPFPVPVFDAGSTIPGFGLQNTDTVIRYRLAAQTLELFTGVEAHQVIQTPA